jgi:hypothetical protein
MGSISILRSQHGIWFMLLHTVWTLIVIFGLQHLRWFVLWLARAWKFFQCCGQERLILIRRDVQHGIGLLFLNTAWNDVQCCGQHPQIWFMLWHTVQNLTHVCAHDKKSESMLFDTASSLIQALRHPVESDSEFNSQLRSSTSSIAEPASQSEMRVEPRNVGRKKV